MAKAQKMAGASNTMAAEWVSPDTLKPWVDNPRDNEASIPEVARSIERFGFASPIIARRADGEIIAGHTRWAAAKQLGLTSVPVRFMDLSLTEARALALADNKVGEIARWDDDKLAKVMSDLQTQDVALGGLGFEDWEIESLLLPEESAPADALADLPVEGGEEVAPAPPEPAHSRLYMSDVPDAIWPTDNDFGIPLLDIAMQADAVDQPFVSWGNLARSSLMRGTYHFYTSDDRFEALWRDPSPVVNSQCVSAVEINYSTSATTPRAVALWTLYKKRWVARFWQSKGIRIIVDVNVNPTVFDDMLLGVPRGWKSYATRGYTGSEAYTEEIYRRCVEHAGGPAGVLFVVYGSGKSIEALCRKHGWLWVREMTHAEKRDQRYEIKAMAEE